LGIAANVEATVTGNGRIEWTPERVTSGGEFSTTNANLAAAFGPVQGLSGTIRFDDLIGLSTPPGQRVAVASINPGIEVIEGEILYQLLPNQQVRIEGGQWPFAGGMLRMHPGLLNFSADQPRYLTFDVEGIDAARFLQRYGFENITATGVFDGVIPTVFDGNGGRVVGGSLVVRDGGGSLAYVGELTNRDLGYFANLAFGALRSVRYDALAIRLNGNIDGEMLTEVSFTGLGQGPGAQNNFLTRQVARLPFAFNIRINAPFRQLLTDARNLYDPTNLVQERLRREALERRNARQPAVQEPESGNQP
jgi:translocation and assembly module TamB